VVLRAGQSERTRTHRQSEHEQGETNHKGHEVWLGSVCSASSELGTQTQQRNCPRIAVGRRFEGASDPNENGPGRKPRCGRNPSPGKGGASGDLLWSGWGAVMVPAFTHGQHCVSRSESRRSASQSGRASNTSRDGRERAEFQGN
jgi:hypothetical protein